MLSPRADSALVALTERPFDGRVALVTGGGTGIGAGITARLADMGAQVMIGQSTDAKAMSVLGTLRKPGRTLDAGGFDLATADGCRSLVDACVKRFGRLDFLINNAGVTGRPALAPFLESDDRHLDRVIDVNLKGAFRCAREAARQMAGQGGGVIVNISSVAAHAAQKNASAYAAAKAGLVGLTRALAFELAPYRIRVVCVSPGDIAVDGNEEGPAVPANQWSRGTPLGRRGIPEDVAGCVAFLCSSDSDFVTGAELVVDGGWLTF